MRTDDGREFPITAKSATEAVCATFSITCDKRSNANFSI